MNTKPNKTQDKSKIRIWTPILIAIFICLGLWSGGMFLTHWYAKSHFVVGGNAESPEALFGDSFGAVNALISAFAFAGVIVSMYFQRKDLDLQRNALEVQKEELTRNTDELALQRAEFQTQNKTMKLQRFENTFFNMLSMQQEIVNALSLNRSRAPNDTIKGREVFEAMYNYEILHVEKKGELIDRRYQEYAERIAHRTKKILNKQYIVSSMGMRSVITDYGLVGYELTLELPLFDHYFRHLYRIVKFVNETNLLENNEERYSYVSMLRATLSRYELIWIYYNCLSEYGCDKFKPLVEEYSLFKNMRYELLSNSKDFQEYIAEKGQISNDYPENDFEFYLTDHKGNSTHLTNVAKDVSIYRYFITAFFNYQSEDFNYYSKYFKMLKTGMLKDEIENKLYEEGNA